MRKPDPNAQAHAKAIMAARRREIDQRQAELPTIRFEGEAALRRLLPVAQRDTGQSSVVARFPLNLYNGERFPFDMTDLRGLDFNLLDDWHGRAEDGHPAGGGGSRLFRQRRRHLGSTGKGMGL